MRRCKTCSYWDAPVCRRFLKSMPDGWAEKCKIFDGIEEEEEKKEKCKHDLGDGYCLHQDNPDWEYSFWRISDERCKDCDLR